MLWAFSSQVHNANVLLGLPAPAEGSEASGAEDGEAQEVVLRLALGPRLDLRTLRDLTAQR